MHIDCHKTCDTCDETFSDRQELKSHLLVHGGEKPYTYSKYGKELPDRRTIKQPVLVHSDEKLYKCNFPGCSEVFAQKVRKCPLLGH